PLSARWLAGRPEGLLGGSWSVIADPDTNDRFQFNHLVLGAVPLASLGDRGRLGEYWAELDRTRLGRGTREAAMLAGAAAPRHGAAHAAPPPARAPRDPRPAPSRTTWPRTRSPTR